MQDYKRIVSYIHTYENNEKKKNVGFGKLEARGGIGKLSISISGQNLQEGRVLGVYLLHIEEYARGIRLGESRVVRGQINAEIRFNTENIMQSGYGLSQMQGIYMTTEEAPYVVFASSWTDAEIIPDKFRIGEEEKTKDEEEKAEQDEAENEMVQAAVISPVTDSAEINEDTLLTSFMESINSLEGFNEQTEDVLNQMSLDFEEKTPWGELCSKYPKVIAFEGAGQPHRMCLKIDLKDLEAIASAKREINENIYLIRSYYKYRYLLLIENEKDPEEKSCILGIPGTYCRNEGSLAKMFGFENFYPTKITENASGSFGYWCKEIML